MTTLIGSGRRINGNYIPHFPAVPVTVSSSTWVIYCELLDTRGRLKLVDAGHCSIAEIDQQGIYVLLKIMRKLTSLIPAD